MNLYSLDGNLKKVNPIENYSSLIWTERYGGDGDFSLIFPTSLDILQTVLPGTLLVLDESAEIMVIDSVDIEDTMKVVGTSLLQWLNNRFIRAIDGSAESFSAQSVSIFNKVPGDMLGYIVQQTCIAGGWLDGAGNQWAIPASHRTRFKLPNLIIGDVDLTGSLINLSIPYSPVWDQLKSIANSFGIGMSIKLNQDGKAVFRSYRGVDRTSRQSVVPWIQFTPVTDTFANIKEIQSSLNYKTNAYAYAPSYTGTGLSSPVAPVLSELDSNASGYGLKALQILDNSYTAPVVTATYTAHMQSEANGALLDNAYVRAIDGEIPASAPIRYGADYSLGDIVDVVGNTGVTNYAQIIEFIRAKDQTGEHEYPTLNILS